MPIVFACICPITSPKEDSRTSAALHRVREELRGYAPELLFAIMPAPSGASKIGIYSSDTTVCERIAATAKDEAIPVERLLRWTLGEPPCSSEGAESVYIATCGLEPRLHFEFGHAAGPTLDRDTRRIGVVSTVELAKDNERFDAQFRRTLAEWDVRAMVGIDQPSRRTARERAVAQTALLMGMLGGYQVQPRELSYEPSATGGQLVVAIDVLALRKRSRIGERQ